ncbi:MAG: hypothetical protein KF721_09850 [Ignavibacteriaceae bacterium]|nr:hypothetical protein [Ignavibacteriaceae bacterium]
MNRTEYKSYLEKANTNELPDEFNPIFILSGIDTKLLTKIASAEINLNELAKRELENRGLDIEGKWIGFDAAQKLNN